MDISLLPTLLDMIRQCKLCALYFDKIRIEMLYQKRVNFDGSTYEVIKLDIMLYVRDDDSTTNK